MDQKVIGILAGVLLLSIHLRADTTTVLDFDPPAFQAGQVVAGAAGITFPDRPVVFTPTSVSTYSGPNALRSAASCDDQPCSSGGWRQRMEFPVGVSELSVRAGTDEMVVAFCFPEGTSCPFYARLQGFDATGAVVADSLDVLIASTENPGFVGPITTRVAIADCAARIRSAVFMVGHGTLNPDRHPGRVQIDHLSFTVPTRPCNTIPDPPTLVIDTPLPDQYFDEHGRAPITGRVTAPGGVMAFCVGANEAALPAAGDCLQAPAVRPDGRFGPLYVDVSRYVEGTNVIAAHVRDFWGQSADAAVTIQLPPPQVDVRVVGMEVTQGVQTEDLLHNNGIPVSYRNVRLIREGKTIVRVYANRSGQGPTRNVTCRLYGFLGSTQYYLDNTGFIRPVNGPMDLSRGGPGVTFEQRVDPEGAFTFVLPITWTRRGTIGLKAVLNEMGESPWLLETPGFAANNSMRVNDVAFVPQVSVEVSPVELIWTDSTGTVMRPPAPSEVFRRAAEISPLAEGGLVARPYAGTIDVTDIVNMGLDRKSRESLIFDRVAAFENQNLSGITMGVGVGLDIGLEKPVVFAWPLRWEPVAIGDFGSRPLTIITHELYHALGFYHAGTNCGGSFPSQSWPPDERGKLQGIGLDRRTGTGGPGLFRIIAPGAPGQPAEYFDLMSYCIQAFDGDAWLSPHNWNAFGGAFPSGLIPADGLTGGTADYQPVGGSARFGSTTVNAVVQLDAEGRPISFQVRKGDGRGIVTGPPESPYLIEVLDAEGRAVSRSPMAGVLDHADEHGSRFSTFSAEVLADGAASVRVLRGGRMVVERLRSRRPPRVEVVSPLADQAVPGEGEVQVRWKGTDGDGDPLAARIEYSADDGASWRVISSGITGDSASLPARLFGKSSRARVRVVVNDGFDDGEATSGLFAAAGTPPEVRIIEPGEGAWTRSDVPLHLAGEAFDDAGRLLDGDRLRWFAGDRFLGTGRQVIADGLAPGQVEIRLEAFDAGGDVGVASVLVDVASSCFREEFSGPAEIAAACSTTVRTGLWRVEGGALRGSSTDEEAWAWAGSPPVVGLPDATYSIEYRFLARPAGEVGRHGGIMFCAATSTSRLDPGNSGYTLDWIDREEDRGLRLISWRNGAGVTLAIGGGHLADPPAAWRVEIDGPTIRCRGDGQLLVEVDDAGFRGGHFGVWTWTEQEVEVDSIAFAARCGEAGKDDLRADFLPCRLPERWRYQSAEPEAPIYGDLGPRVLPRVEGIVWSEPEEIGDGSLHTGLARDIPRDALLLQARRGADNVASWLAPGPGTVSIAGYLGIAGEALECSRGLTWTIHKNDELEKPFLLEAIRAGGRSGQKEIAIKGIEVATGDAIRFRASTTAEGPCARGLLSARIDFRPAEAEEPPSGGLFRRDDANGDGSPDLSDAVFVLGYLFLGSPAALSCPAAADANDDDAIDLSDPISVLNHLYLGGTPPREPYAACGSDPTPGALGCEASPGCP